MGILILFGALPATFLCLFAFMASTSGFIRFTEEPNWTNAHWFLVGTAGLAGTASLWRIILGRGSLNCYLGLLLGVFAVTNLPFMFYDSGPRPWNNFLFSWFMVPVVVVAYLWIEMVVRVWRISRKQL